MSALLFLAATAALFSDEYVRVAFDDAGAVSSIRETASGRELIATPQPFVSAILDDGRTVRPSACRAAEGGLVFEFPDGVGSLRYAVTPFAGGWTFESTQAQLKGVRTLTLGRLAPVCAKEKGGLSNIVMDDRSAVVLRGYQPEIEMDDVRQSEAPKNDGATWVAVGREFGFKGRRFGLAAGPADKILAMLAAMAKVDGLDHTGCGGPKSLTREANRASYLFGTWMDKGGEDDWIHLLDKAGCRTFHLHAWWNYRGSYEVNPKCFPGGMADMKKLVDRLHADGKRVTTHSLSAVVQFGDPHIAPKWYDDLATDAEYTLAKDYRRGDTVLWVNEKPVAFHEKAMDGCGNGNVLRLGDDLLQYDDFTTEPPYKFLGVHVAREPFGDVGVHDATQALGAEYASEAVDTGRRHELVRDRYAKGTKVSYLHHRYAEFVAKPGSRLAEELTDRLAGVYNELGLDGIYFDGAEAMNSRYAIDWTRERTLAKIKNPRNGTIINSTSCRNPFNWWSRSLAGTWDHPMFAPRAFHDRHIRIYRDRCHADFLRTDLGWWDTRVGNASARGYFPEEQEYVMCKTAANDMTISLQGPRPSDGPLVFINDFQLTIFGKWERARYARAIRPDLLAAMREDGRFFRLDQDDTGLWTAREVYERAHRVPTADFGAWRFDVPAAGPAKIRVESLYGAVRGETVTRMLDASMVPALDCGAAAGVRVSVAKAKDPAHGETIRLTATNESAEPRAAWARAMRLLPPEKALKGGQFSSVWVKGDGSGATLNLRLRTEAKSRGSSCVDHFVVLDFTGWRQVELLMRERDTEASSRFVWPYDRDNINNPDALFSPMGGGHVELVALYMNGLRRGQTATAEVGAWDTLPQGRGVLAKGSTVTLNGAALAIPFDLPSGDYAMCEDGCWTHFSERGEPLNRLPASVRPMLLKGANAASYASAGKAFARAEVTVFGAGKPEAAYVPLSAEQKRLMRVEYEMPSVLNPEKGLVGPYPVRVRPGERADVRFEILGPVKNPVVDGRRMEVTLASPQERVASYDGKTWQAIRIVPGACGPDNRTKESRREPIASGAFERPFAPLASGRHDLAVTADEARGARVTFFKEYR